MKKPIYSKTFLATLAAITLSSYTAEARESGLKPYVGIDAEYHDYSVDLGNGLSYDDDLFAGNVHIGFRPHKNFGVETGYFRTEDISLKSNTGSLKATIQGASFDMLGYLPVHDKVDLIGTGGVLFTVLDAKFSSPFLRYEGSESEVGFRGGAGAQFNVTESFNLRAIARYQQFASDVDSVSLSVGANYAF